LNEPIGNTEPVQSTLKILLPMSVANEEADAINPF